MLATGIGSTDSAATAASLGAALWWTDTRGIIGILPSSFHFMNLSPSLVLPFQLNRADAFVGNFSYQAVARLTPGATSGRRTPTWPVCCR